MAFRILADNLAAALSFELITGSGREIIFENSEISRPGLQFADYYEHFQENRVQVIGDAEWYYLCSLSDTELRSRMEHFMSLGVPCVVCSRNNQPPDILLHCAEAGGVPVFKTPLPTGEVQNRITDFISNNLAPKILMHGELLDVFGVGVLLMGESGMGKSETALELIKGGHRLVADDVVQITRLPEGRLRGAAPEPTRYRMEVRGIGVIDVRYLFGVGAVMEQKDIDFVIELELWNENAEYDRMAGGGLTKRILDIEVPCTVVPVSPGRNLAVVVEVAARKFRLGRLGYDVSGRFDEMAREVFAKKNNR